MSAKATTRIIHSSQCEPPGASRITIRAIQEAQLMKMPTTPVTQGWISAPLRG
jgi:hypothetical protein